MSYFFLLLEIFIYVFGFYIFRKKKELAFIYLPVIFFAFSAVTPILPVNVFYGFVTLLILYTLKKKYSFLNENIFSVIIFIYFIILLFQANSTIKLGLVYAVLLFFIALPIINCIYKEHIRSTIVNELTNTAILILIIFIVNVIFASLTKYSESMYGISNGVLYGNLKATDFNVMGIALFIVLFRILKKYNLYLVVTYVVTMALIMLTLRRTAMLVSILGIPFAILSTLTQQTIRKVALSIVLFSFLGAIVYFNTEFASVFQERYELRNLEERALEEEKRFFEYDILYHDMFVLKDYSPWFGYQLFNSAGNYGRGIFDERTLHADLTSIAHSSGLVGVVLYILMILLAFYKALKASRTKEDYLTVLYCFIVFVVYTITGRYTQVEAMLLLFLVANLSLTKKEEEQIETNITERATSVLAY
jgi:hypothetical protein